MSAFTLCIVLAASVSPLLTFTALWQVKEWRTDRLLEHLRNEGVFRQLLGTIRPVIVLLFTLFALLIEWTSWPFLTLTVLTVLTGTQFLVRRQPRPVWTKKAIMVCMVSLLLTAGTSAFIVRTGMSLVWLTFIPILQPLFIGCAWMILKPIDLYLKTRIMTRAKVLRARHKDLIVIGITGSVGKTTTKELIAHIVKDQQPLVTPSYVNSEMGVSQWLIRELATKRPGDVRLLIAELGAYHRGEIRTLCEIIRPHIGVVTFIGKQHIALFGSLEALSQAKGELLEALPHDGAAFINADCDLCLQLMPKALCPVIKIGTGGTADIEAFDIEETPHGISFRVGSTSFSVPLHGTHNTTNILLAIGVARYLGLKDNEIAAKLQSFQPLSHTFNVRTEGSVTLLDDTHNASPASFKAAIGWARNQPAREKVLLTSGIIELGEEQDAIHTELGSLAASVFSRVIFTQKRSAQNFEKGFGHPVEIANKQTGPISEHGLLACIGRVPPSLIPRLLPKQ